MSSTRAAKPTTHNTNLAQLIPILTWLIAGLTLWGLVVPEGMAYAGIAGLPPQAGLYTLIGSLLVYAVFGSSRHLSVQATVHHCTACVARSSFCDIFVEDKDDAVPREATHHMRCSAPVRSSLISRPLPQPQLLRLRLDLIQNQWLVFQRPLVVGPAIEDRTGDGLCADAAVPLLQIGHAFADPPGVARFPA